jgi:hypothetical protein
MFIIRINYIKSKAQFEKNLNKTLFSPLTKIVNFQPHGSRKILTTSSRASIPKLIMGTSTILALTQTQSFKLMKQGLQDKSFPKDMKLLTSKSMK